MAYNNYGTNQQNTSFIPVSNNTLSFLKKTSSNFSLVFPRLVEWEYNGNTQEVKPQKNNSEELLKLGNERISKTENYLSAIQSRQKKIMDTVKNNGQQVISISAKLISPFITGLGSGHPTETGMILDRNTGVPYIPASSIKGVMRLAYAINIAEGRSDVPDSELAKYFGDVSTGTNSKRGQLVFLDAYPVCPPKLHQDIMNPHFGKYYSGENELPLETESPVPIKFISVEQGTVFCFNTYFMPIGSEKFTEEDMKTVKKIFETAFSVVGFGDKTSIGYGRFKEISEFDIKKIELEIKAASYLQLEQRKEYDAVLTGKNAKGTVWIANVDGTGDTKCTITQGVIPADKKEGDKIRILVITAPNNGNCNCKYLGE